MADEWYFMKNGRKIGPLSSKAIVDLAASGKLVPTDGIQKKGATSWQEASTVKGLFPKPPVPPTAVIESADLEEPLPGSTTAFGNSPLTTPPAIPIAANIGNDAALTVQRYKYLDWYITSSRMIARILFALIAVTGLYPFLIELMAALVGGKSDGLATGLVVTLFTLPFAAIIGYLTYMVQMAGADFLSAVRDIEENTRSRSA